MSNSEKWKKESATAVASLSATLVSSTATGFPDVAKVSGGVTYLIVNEFHFARSPDAVEDVTYEDLKSQITDLKTQIEKLPGPKTQAFKCKQDFDSCWQLAKDKSQKWHCLMTYGLCLAHGFNLFFPVPNN